MTHVMVPDGVLPGALAMGWLLALAPWQSPPRLRDVPTARGAWWA
jgi:hypothetical protein